MSIDSRAEKQARIQELREAIARLETELQKDIENEQHEVIERLEDHFDVVETKLSSLKAFWQQLKRELLAAGSR